MKNLLTIVLIIICYSVKAQKEFAPIGAEWYYSKSASYSPPVFGYIKHKCINDSIIEGQSVKVIEVTHSPNNFTTHLLGYEYLLQKGDTIFFWKSGEFHLLYNFALQKGDSLLLYSEMQNKCSEQTNYGWNIVDSVYSKTINNIELKAYTISGIGGSVWGSDYPTFEIIGNLNYLFPQNIFCGVYDSPQYGSLRCYSDSSIGFFQFNSTVACDSTTNYPEGIELVSSQHFITLYPNPAQNEVFIKFDNWKNLDDLKAICYDMMGNKMSETKIIKRQSSIDVSSFPKGNYVIIIKSNNKAIDYEKICKE